MSRQSLRRNVLVKIIFSVMFTASVIFFGGCAGDGKSGETVNTEEDNIAAAAEETGDHSDNIGEKETGKSTKPHTEAETEKHTDDITQTTAYDTKPSTEADKTPSVTEPAQCRHNYVVTQENASGCTYDGNRTYTCSKCGVSYSEKIPAAGHAYIDTVIPSTCISEGYTAHTCSRCGVSYTDTVTAKSGHSYNQGAVITAATDYSPGMKRYTCTVCGVSYEQQYALPHTVDIGKGQTATVCGYWDLTASEEMFGLLNAYRQSNGLPACSKDSSLDASARTRALECAYYFSHTRPNGNSCFSVYPGSYSSLGENIASGYNDAASVMEGWKNSPTHNANMLTAEYNYAAASLFVIVEPGNAKSGGTYFSQSFMSR